MIATAVVTPITRTIAYIYDGLNRLTDSVKVSGSGFAYIMEDDPHRDDNLEK